VDGDGLGLGDRLGDGLGLGDERGLGDGLGLGLAPHLYGQQAADLPIFAATALHIFSLQPPPPFS
jgi:hypothetical protein